MVCRKNPKPAIGEKISSFQQELGKADPRSGITICRKRVHDTILESYSAKDYSKTGDSFQNTGIVNRLENFENAGQRNHENVEYHILGQFLNNFPLVKKKNG